jgi:hypothetical protein
VVGTHSCTSHKDVNSSSEVAVFRNAGGRAREAVFDIAVLDSIIEITEIIIVHHQSKLPSPIDCWLDFNNYARLRPDSRKERLRQEDFG